MVQYRRCASPPLAPVGSVPGSVRAPHLAGRVPRAAQGVCGFGTHRVPSKARQRRSVVSLSPCFLSALQCRLVRAHPPQHCAAAAAAAAAVAAAASSRSAWRRGNGAADGARHEHVLDDRCRSLAGNARQAARAPHTHARTQSQRRPPTVQEPTVMPTATPTRVGTRLEKRHLTRGGARGNTTEMRHALRAGHGAAAAVRCAVGTGPIRRAAASVRAFMRPANRPLLDRPLSARQGVCGGD